jgi:ABC-type polysaccharide/polyol phosphate export permease
MTLHSQQSMPINWAYFIVALIVCAIFFQTFSESLCSLSGWFSDTCAARVAAVKP